MRYCCRHYISIFFCSHFSILLDSILLSSLSGRLTSSERIRKLPNYQIVCITKLFDVELFCCFSEKKTHSFCAKKITYKRKSWCNKDKFGHFGRFQHLNIIKTLRNCSVAAWLNSNSRQFHSLKNAHYFNYYYYY